MSEETLVLTMLSFVMLVGSYMAGSIPLVMKLSEGKLKMVTVLGAGLLVGTALAVIIPEGIRSLYIESNQIKQHTVVETASTLSNSAILVQDQNGHNHNQSHNADDHTQTIGLSLVLGFVFMMLIDQISQRQTAVSNTNITATLGLVVHSAADGVALGAAATTSHQDVEIIVFLAIMLHKAPAAFGLVSFLLHEKVDRQQIRKHLGIFSLSAPVLALLTYFGIGQEQKETLNSINATGIAMLFSAGTFLYVATVHVLPELTQMGGKSSYSMTQGNQYEYRILADGSESQTSTTQNSHSHNHGKGLRFSEVICMVCGAFLPLLITFKHHH